MLITSRLPPNVDAADEPFAKLADIQQIARLITNVLTQPLRLVRSRNIYKRMQTWIRIMQNNSVTQEMLTRANVLNSMKNFLSDNNQRLRTLKRLPEEILEDLTILHRKWDFGDFSILPYRGLIPGGPIGYRPDPEWPFKRSSDFYGHGHLMNGQVWSSRAEMMRDGAHGPPIAGISGTIKRGARSIVMGLHMPGKKDYYADVDQNDTI